MVRPCSPSAGNASRGTPGLLCMYGHFEIGMHLISQSLENKVILRVSSAVVILIVDCVHLDRRFPMVTQPASPARYVFGAFEVDAATGEVRKRGVRLHLSGQPLQILVILLAHPGELVAREQLRNEVWNETTFVDLEHGLNAAMNKLRRALGDSAENPRYIENHPGSRVSIHRKMSGSGQR
jgi:DNA-binding winged helix-turn-helix (wHTH) protein